MKKKFLVVALMAALSTVGYAEVSLEQKVEENRVIATQAQNNAAHALIQNSKQDKDIAALEQNKVSKEEFDKKTEENRVIATQAQNNAAHALIQNSKQDKDIAALEQNKVSKDELENKLNGKADVDFVTSQVDQAYNDLAGKVDEKLEGKVDKEDFNRLDNEVGQITSDVEAMKGDLNNKVNKDEFEQATDNLQQQIDKNNHISQETDKQLNDKIDKNTTELNDKIDANKAEQDKVNAAQKENNEQQQAAIETNKNNIAANAEKIEALQQNFAQYDGRLSGLEKKVDHLDDKMNKGLSLMAAMNAVDFQNVQTGEMALGAGIGHYGNAQSVALGVAYAPVEDLTVNAKYSITAGDPDSFAVGAGATYKFKVGR